MISIVNWLITRRCNLNCSYCRIASDYNHPKEYPPLSYFIKNEMSTYYILETLYRFKKHNKECFHIFYGGEPSERIDLYKIVGFCNDNDIHYTIISNFTESAVRKLKEMIPRIRYFKGLTTSIDPDIMNTGDNQLTDQFKKSLKGISHLEEFKRYCNDLVAEITVTKYNLKYLYDLVEELSKRGINSDITFVDIAKSNYYDFSNVTDKDILVEPTEELKEILNKISENNLNCHMKELLFPKFLEILPSELNCDIDKNVHNLTIDSDGSVRLCLRIRGIETPKKDILYYLNQDGSLKDELQDNIKIDKDNLCLGCNHTCLLHSKFVEENIKNTKELLHI